MRQNQIKVGNTYEAKVSDKVVPVVVRRIRPNGGGYDCTNVTTGRSCFMRTAGRFRKEIT